MKTIFEYKGKLFRFSCGLLALLLLLCSCGGETEGVTSGGEITTEAPTSAEPLRIVENGASEYTVVYSRAVSDDVFLSILTLIDTVKAQTGATLRVRRLEKGESAEGIHPAILIGKEVCGVDKTLRKMDYVIRASEGNILINAQSEDELLRALGYFSQKLIPSACDSGAFVLDRDYQYLRSASYIYKGMELLGAVIGEYTLVIPKEATFYEVRTAKLISEYIASNAGYCTEIVTDDAPVTEREILIGQTNRAPYQPIDYTYTVEARGTKLLLQAADLYSFGAMTDYVVEKLLFSLQDRVTLNEVPRVTQNVSGKLSKLQQQRYGSYRVLFNNILGNCDQELYPVARRNEMLLEIYRSYAPDAIGLQECSVNSRNNSSIIEALRAEGYDEVSVTGCSGNVFTPVLYRRDRLELVASGYRLFKLNADRDNSKSLVWAVLRDRTTKETFAVISTHFTVYGSDTNPVETARVGNATELLEEVARIRETYDCPIVMGGDLNCNLSSDALKLLAENGVLAQSEAPVTNHSKTTHKYPTYSKDLNLYVEYAQPKQNASAESIDHIWFFNQKNVTVNAFDVCWDKYACLSTDHCPLIVDFSFGTQS